MSHQTSQPDRFHRSPDCDHGKPDGTTRRLGRAIAGALLASGLVAAVGFAATSRNAAKAAQGTVKQLHLIVYHLSSNDPAAMQHALSNADNAMKDYRARGEDATIEIVANGGGVHMMRADTSPVAASMRYIRSTYPNIVFSACGTTKSIMERNEKRSLSFLDGVRVVPAGIVRVVELQEQRYAYVRP